MNFVNYFCLVSLVYFLGNLQDTYGQSMDPRVTIRATEPPSIGHRIRGGISRDVTIDCYVENLPAELKVQWQRSLYDKEGRETTQLIAQDMAVEDNMKWSIEKPTTYTWRVRIKAIQVSDEGNYTCFVRLTGNNNRAEANRTVLVTNEPDILEAMSSSNIAVQEGDFVPMRCNASGRPLPTMMWRREGNSILPGGGTRRIGSFFDIEQVGFEDRGTYICEALNEVGYDRRDIFLDVTFPPKIFPDPEVVGQKIGHMRTLSCAIEANPIPSIDITQNQLTWWHKSNAVLSGGRFSIQAIYGAYGRLTFEVSINPVQEQDYGEYICMASNSFGTNTGKVTLIKTDDVQPDKRGLSHSPHLSANVLTIFMTLILFRFL